MPATTVRSAVVPGRAKAAAPSPTRRPMSVSGYLDAPFAEVLETLAGHRAQAVLESALVNGLEFADGEVTVELGRPIIYANGSAELRLTWRGDDGRGRTRAGAATVAVLQVQSGAHPVSELLVRTEVDRSTAGKAAWAIHRCLDELAAILE